MLLQPVSENKRSLIRLLFLTLPSIIPVYQFLKGATIIHGITTLVVNTAATCRTFQAQAPPKNNNNNNNNNNNSSEKTSYIFPNIFSYILG